MNVSQVLSGTVAVGVLVTGIAVTTPMSAQAEEKITIASWGGAYSLSQRKAFHEPIMKELGVRVIEDEWAGENAVIRAMVETGAYKWQLIDGNAENVMAGCEEGFLEQIDYDRLGGKDQFFEKAVHECGVGSVSASWVMAYDPDQIKGDPPRNWADFWNVEKIPGKRGMPKGPKVVLEWALIADGVPPSQVYDVLSTDDGLDRAFSKLDELKPDTIWWEAGAQAPQLLADEEVVMAGTWSGRIYTAIAKEGQNFKIVWDGQAIEYGFWFIPRGAPDQDLIYKFLQFAVRPDRQADATNYISYGPSVKAAMALVSPDMLPYTPLTEKNLVNSFWIGAEFWGNNLDALTERFTAWATK